MIATVDRQTSSSTQREDRLRGEEGWHGTTKIGEYHAFYAVGLFVPAPWQLDRKIAQHGEKKD
jgi:hypothetical protein